MRYLPYAGVLLFVLGAAVVVASLGFVSHTGYSPIVGVPWLVAGAAMVAVGILAVAISWKRSPMSHLRKDSGIALTVTGVVLVGFGMLVAADAASCTALLCVSPLLPLEFFVAPGIVILVPGFVLWITSPPKG